MKKPLLIDGAMGTELINRGINLPLPIWSADSSWINSHFRVLILATFLKSDKVDIIKLIRL